MLWGNVLQRSHPARRVRGVGGTVAGGGAGRGGNMPGEGHFLGRDVDGDGGGVDDVVVAAVDGAERAVGLGFEPGHFVCAAAVAFDVFAVADGSAGAVVGEVFGAFVGVPAVFQGHGFAGVFGRGVAGVEVGIYVGNLVQDGVKMVAFKQGVVLLAVAGFEGIRFDHEQGVAVPGGDLRGLPCQQVVVDVGGVSGHPFQCAVGVGEHQAVEHADY